MEFCGSLEFDGRRQRSVVIDRSVDKTGEDVQGGSIKSHPKNRIKSYKIRY